MRIPTSTYRLQINRDFDLGRAAEIMDYIRALGADWVYFSPLLTAEEGSDHGYDVTDHSLVDPARGGDAGLQSASSRAHDLGLGVLVDIVPNHVGVATPIQNRWWWDVLTHGRGSRYADAFDVDWDFGDGRIRIPVLDDDADAGIRIEDGELRYQAHRFPLAPGSASDGVSPNAVHARQHYELIDWRRADTDLNYRRFFAVNTLAGIRVEEPWVFAESHAEIARWIETGLADGLRVDHPDGLADPGGYLDSLAAATNGTYVLVEKILEGDEDLPPFWAAAGTTGYDALADIDRVLIDPTGDPILTSLDARLGPRTTTASWTEIIHDSKRAVADGMLRSEVLRIERDLEDLARSSAAGEHGAISAVADAIAELLACFPVYRSYLPHGRQYLDEAAELAKQRLPHLADTIDAVVTILADPTNPAAVRFQQTSGMVMAKGVEDSAFYRYNRLSSLTEVGADPSEFSIDVAEFHHRQQRRQATLPASLTTLTTHDTKRGEDVRARLNVLAELPREWHATITALRDLVSIDDAPLEQLLWQAVIGAWPASRERLHAYAEKAAREAGNSTHWTAPAERFETRMHHLIDSAFDDGNVTAVIDKLLDPIVRPGWSNSLSAKLIQLTAPGVPDVYQGSELWETSLVDPDNRRPVDFDLRRRYLEAIDEGALPDVDETGVAKLLVVTRALRLRREQPEIFTRYAPLAAQGTAAQHAVAFDRGNAVTVATRLPVGLEESGGWGDTAIVLSGRPLIDVITGQHFDGGTIPIGSLLARYPVCLLVPA